MKIAVALAWTSLSLCHASASAQSLAPGDAAPSDLKSEVDALKAENAAVRELLHKLEEQQKALLAQLDLMQRRREIDRDLKAIRPRAA